MKPLLIIFVVALITCGATAQVKTAEDKDRINIFIFGREKGKMNVGGVYTGLRARIHSVVHHRKFRIINAWSARQAADKIEMILTRENKMLGNIWFDSHGHYGNRYSSFRIGKDEFSFKTINDTEATKNLRRIAKYTDGNTKVAMGSCYAGADFYFPATDSTPASRMNGDSLMIGMGKIFSNSTIFGSESWVMTRPGTFSNGFALAGFPIERKFHDVVYEPVWERIGLWKQYSSADNKLTGIYTVALNRWGQISVKPKNYNELTKSKNKIARVKPKLRPGLAKFT